MDTQICLSCGKELPMTREYFGHTPSKNFRKKCRKCMSEHTKNHDKSNPEQAKQRSDLRRLRESNAEGSYNNTQIEQIREMLGDCCAYCCLKLNNGGYVDHKTPLAKGGNNLIDNLTLACFQCNTEKHAKTVFEYYIWRLERNLPLLGAAFQSIAS